MTNDISLITAFAAGIFSFVSPCVLPLLSSYIMLITGAASNRTDVSGNNYLAGLTLCFVLGFSVVFVLLSVIFYGVFNFFGGGLRQILNIGAGIIIVVLGANIIFNFIPFLKFDTDNGTCETCAPSRPVLKGRRFKGAFGVLLAGMAFGAGWTPCVSAFLGSILLLSASLDTIAKSIVYLAVYSAGLGLPFIITGIFWGKIAERLLFSVRFKRATNLLRIASGVFLAAMGIIILFGKSFALNAFLNTAI